VVQSKSLERLYEIDFQLVVKHAEALISSNDANVRRWVAKAMIDTQEVGRIEMLCSLLDDVNPTLRRDVAAGLIELAEIEGLHDEVIERTTEVLNRDQWRGCEQAVVVLTRLDHKPSGKRMVELLGHERGDVQVASAWGLSELRMKELLPDMLDHARSVYDGFKSGQLNDNMQGASRHVAHLFIAFGDQRYKEADSLMRKYLPKDFSLGYQSRPAAAWALGLLFEDDAQEDLVPILERRLNDVGPEPEDDDMRQMCATALGRMKAESAIPSLRKNAGISSAGFACYWAIERMTGEMPPPPKRESSTVEDWFLMPIRNN
jgi:HEAT repeat protein